MKRLPGFTAEASVYNMNGYYKTAIKAGQVSGAVYPAQLMAELFRHSQWGCLSPKCIRLPLGNGQYALYCYCW